MIFSTTLTGSYLGLSRISGADLRRCPSVFSLVSLTQSQDSALEGTLRSGKVVLWIGYAVDEKSGCVTDEDSLQNQSCL